jgi:hypothetical protein
MYHGTDYNGQKIVVEPSRRRNARDKTPGKYLGRSKRRRSLFRHNPDREATADPTAETATETPEDATAIETTALGTHVIEAEIALGREEIDPEIEEIETVITEGETTGTEAAIETTGGEKEEAVLRRDTAEGILNNL